MGELLGGMVSELRGSYPDVPFAPGVDAEGIREDDANPMFVTLPLVKVGGVSRNGLHWKREAVERVVAQINDKRPEGYLGHVPAEKRATQFEFGKLRWVGAKLADDGTAWAKAYVPKYAEDARDYFRLAKRTGAFVGTSVYGMKGEAGLEDMQLESIDLGHPDRVANPASVAVPMVTSEMTLTPDPSPSERGEAEKAGDVTENKQESEPVDENKTAVAELTALRDAAMGQVAELTAQIEQGKARIAELQTAADTLAQISELVGGDPLEAVRGWMAEKAAAAEAARSAAIGAVVTELVALEALRPTVLAQLGAVQTADEARVRVTELMAREDIQVIAEALAQRTMGPRAVVGAAVNAAELLKQVGDPKFAAEARSMFGF